MCLGVYLHRGKWENKSSNLCMCALVAFQKGGNSSKRTQMCVWIGAHVTAFSRVCVCVCLYPAATVFVCEQQL